MNRAAGVFDLTVLFSLDPLSSVLSFSFDVGLFFLGSAVFFDIDLNLRLVNYLLMAAAYFFLFLHIVLSEEATVQPYCKNKDMPIRVNRNLRLAARAYYDLLN